MAYDLVVGKSKFVKDDPIIVGEIEFEEYPVICTLLKKQNSSFLNRISDQFSDSTFSVYECSEAQRDLCALLTHELNEEQRILVHKLVSVITYAILKGEPLHGVSD